ncbi:MAG: helix-turn-helix transcriptional regulator [Chloroflexi bacterium]|nr:helix-turn-helix transcriptional regulator [Chloroflexota bacterium]
MDARQFAYSLTPTPFRTEATAIDLVHTEGLLKSLCPGCRQRVVERVAGRSKMSVNAEALWEYLERHNLSQNDLARSLGITSGYLSLLVNGLRHPSPAMRRRLASVINAPNLFIRT